MLRFFLFMVSVMAIGTSAAKDVSPCPIDAVPIQIMTPGSDIKRSVAEISSDPHFHAFVEAVTEHIAARLIRDNLCMNGAEGKNHSLLQFVYWQFAMPYDYDVPILFPGGPFSCRISSPWIDLVVDRGEVTQVRGIVRWNERQLVTDQAVLAGTKNVPPDMAMPLDLYELSYFVDEVRRKSAAKPVEARVPPDILWLLRSLVGTENLADVGHPRGGSMYLATKNGAEGYTKLVLALIDRCFVPTASGKVDVHYKSILDIADPILLEQYKIKTRSLH
ncbi:MAG: hypothetical protein LBB76_10845 [Azoarcus sp.]|jgi:hypothetical protein|nr:hypothetical protein [Azoarcus sp.]